ncbi:putative spermidine/putrescine transport system substrate-binding protein [Enterococcus sp. PF1-24]|uniref:ABC transporter substrate-binding protein n=1 Tax=unclassified Enterococcus TaxID=2608891 RepID=UPI002476A6DA|nr:MULTISPECIES: ABC transporter substrate-binding protein [unclassified Enterococcus]MDH6363537.1 putative spermidine/putrescine transport system substrate-binding protein [Enterococcus sp. PFB1-1]MDH6400772.1 putative spermidine/putrescine transport system substrate-binding protein [Enterococcus sp. PF1-24]
MKKKFLLGTVALASALVLGACGGSTEKTADSGSDTGSKASQEMVLSTFGLSEDIVKSDVIKPFEDKFGATVTMDLGNSGDRLTKLANNPNSGIDVIELAQANASDGGDQGLFEKLDEAKLPNLADLTDGAKEVFDSGAGVPYTVNSVGIIYDSEKVGEITEWADLWSEDLAGKVAIPDITTTGGPLMMYIASEYAGVDITSDNGEAAFEALEELKPNIVKTYAKSSDLANMFAAGEIEVAVVLDFAYDIVKGDSETMEYLVPTSGTYANYNTMNIVKDAKNKDLAYEYINYRIGAESQKSKVAALNEAPVNTTVGLSEDEVGNKTVGEIADRAKMVDFTFVNEQLNTWVDQWNRLLNN